MLYFYIKSRKESGVIIRHEMTHMSHTLQMNKINNFIPFDAQWHKEQE